MVRVISQALLLSLIFLLTVLTFQVSAADIVVYVDSLGEALSGGDRISVHGTLQMPDNTYLPIDCSAHIRNSNGTIEIKGEAGMPGMLMKDAKGKIKTANKSIILFFDAPVKIGIFGGESDNITIPLSDYDIFIENLTGDFVITNATMYFGLNGKNTILNAVEKGDIVADGKKFDFTATIIRSETESRIGEEKTAKEMRPGISLEGIEIIKVHRIRGHNLYVIFTIPFYYFLAPLGILVAVYVAYRFRISVRKT